MRRGLDFQKTLTQPSFGSLTWTSQSGLGAFAYAKQQKWVVSIFHFVASGAVFVQLCPGVPWQRQTAPGEELLSEYFKVGQAGSCFVRFISKDFQCLQWEAIFILSRGYLLL